MEVSSPKRGGAQHLAAQQVTGSRFDREPQSPVLGRSRSKEASRIQASALREARLLRRILAEGG
jgi:hypothetical protein